MLRLALQAPPAMRCWGVAAKRTEVDEVSARTVCFSSEVVGAPGARSDSNMPGGSIVHI